MQYKTVEKIIIDKRKLDLLLRLSIDKMLIIDFILTGKFTRTGDSLIDDTLESLLDIKTFNNWGGFRKGSGKKSFNKQQIISSSFQDEKQFEKQDDNQLANQDINQVVDIDKDIDTDIDTDIDIYNNRNYFLKEKSKKNAVSDCNIKKQEDNPYPNPQDNPQDNPLYNKNKNRKKEQEQEYKQEQEILFEEFWSLYTPIKKSDGYFVPKQDKKGCKVKFIKLLENGENYANIRSGLEQYLKHCQRTGTPSCGVSVFLNQRRWESDYRESQAINSEESRGSSDLANAMRGFLEDTYF